MVRQPIFGVLEVLGRAAFFRWLPFRWRSGARLSAGVVGCAARDQSLGSSDTAQRGSLGALESWQALGVSFCTLSRACPCTGLCANIHMFDSEAFEVARCLTSLAGLFFFDRASALDQLA